MRNIPNDQFFSWVEEELSEGHPVRFRLKGRSMFPCLRDGRDEVVLYPCTEDELRPMDVVLFRHGGKHILHRIIKRKGDSLCLRGDGSFSAREQCMVADVVGKVRFIVRQSGRILYVDKWYFRLLGRLWNKSGIFRVLLLKFLHRCYV